MKGRKRWLKRPVILVSFLFAAAAAYAYLVDYHYPVAKWIAGRGEVSLSDARASVTVGGVRVPGAKCFLVCHEGGRKVDHVVLWLPVKRPPGDGEYIVVDRANGLVGHSNSGPIHRELVWGRLLFQSDSAYGLISFTEAKSFEEAPHLQLYAGGLRFTLPRQYWHWPGQRVDVKL